VFAYNKIGIDFYNKNGYHHRMYTDIKKLWYVLLVSIYKYDMFVHRILSMLKQLWF
jgi:hypothetical protein